MADVNVLQGGGDGGRALDESMAFRRWVIV